MVGHLGVDRALPSIGWALTTRPTSSGHGHFQNAARALDGIAFGDMLVFAQNHGADGVALEVQRQAKRVAVRVGGIPAFRPASRPDRPWMRTIPSVTDTTVPWLRMSLLAASPRCGFDQFRNFCGIELHDSFLIL